MRYNLILPFRNEFGTMISYYTRWVHGLDVPNKLVCIKRGHECLFPSASGFFYDWVDTEDRWKRGIKTFRHKNHKEYVKNLECRIRDEFDIDKAFVPVCPKRQPVKFLRENNFVPKLDCKFGISCDVALAPRYREHASSRNYPRESWQYIADSLRDRGFRVGCLGLRDFSFDIDVDVKSWDYVGGLSSDIELLYSCKLAITLDSGLAHLAVLCSVPLKIIYGERGRLPGSNIHWMLHIHKGLATNHCEPIIGGWEDPSVVVDESVAYLK